MFGYELKSRFPKMVGTIPQQFPWGCSYPKNEFSSTWGGSYMGVNPPCKETPKWLVIPYQMAQLP